MVRLLWDENKRAANREKHGLDFDVLTEDFFADATILVARSGRNVVIGWLDERPVTVIFVYGREALSIVSMRAASHRERRLI